MATLTINTIAVTASMAGTWALAQEASFMPDSL
jgi:hypothetical protein